MNAFSKSLIVICCIAVLVPLAWNAMSSLKSPSELMTIPPTLLARDATVENYYQLFVRKPFLRYYLNSFTIASTSSLFAVFVGSLAAYQLARLRGRVRSGVQLMLLVVAFFPPIVFLFPLYEMIRAAGLVNHPWGLILPYSALNLPFTIWFLTGAFEQIPYELEEAAAIDGLSGFQTYYQVVLPLVKPALITAGILVFIFAWNEFMLALTFINMDTQKTVTLGVATLSGAFSFEIPWGQIAAGVMVSSIPLMILAVVFQKRIVAGLTAGAIK
jgi:multiple sugar transport system permease protein